MDAVRLSVNHGTTGRHQGLRRDVPADDVVVGVVDLRGDERGVVFLREIERGQDVGELREGHRSIIYSADGSSRSAGSSEGLIEMMVTVSLCAPLSDVLPVTYRWGASVTKRGLSRYRESSSTSSSLVAYNSDWRWGRGTANAVLVRCAG